MKFTCYLVQIGEFRGGDSKWGRLGTGLGAFSRLLAQQNNQLDEIHCCMVQTSGNKHRKVNCKVAAQSEVGWVVEVVGFMVVGIVSICVTNVPTTPNRWRVIAFSPNHFICPELDK